MAKSPLRFLGRQVRRGLDAVADTARPVARPLAEFAGLTETKRTARLNQERERQRAEAEARARALDEQAAALRQRPTAAPQVGGFGQVGVPPPPTLQRRVPTVPGALPPDPADSILGRAGQDVRGQQSQLNAAILERALGQGGPSPAEFQQRQALERNIATQRALAAGNRASSVGGAQRIAAGNIAQLSAQSAQDAALLRAQEQIAAQRTAMQGLSGQRGQDLQRAVSSAQIQTQRDLANLNAQLRTMGLGLEERMFLIRTAMAERGFSSAQIDAAVQQEMARQSRQDRFTRDAIGGIATGGASFTGGAG